LEAGNLSKESFFSEKYKQFFYSDGASSWATRIIHKATEKEFKSNKNHALLEIGGGEGFHVPYVFPDFRNYTILDKVHRPLDTTAQALHAQKKLVQIIGDASNLQMSNDKYDRVILMCVLHHLQLIEESLQEARRVCSPGGIISIYLPCDPGFVYRSLRVIFTFRQARKLGINYKTINAFEHRNHVSSLMTIVKHVFAADAIVSKWRPFPIKTWNFNLFVILKITKRMNFG
jgi:phosphatidylethanolamine/phosphatidyl-N-methylethanolamine N-methyltransferase